MAALMTWIANLINSIGVTADKMPPVALTQCYVILMFVTLDTISGGAVAILAGKLRSNKLRNQLFAKGVQYSCLVGICAGIGLLVHNWIFPESAGMAVIGFEFLSIIENVARLEIHGVNMGPIKPLLAFVSRYVDVAPQDVAAAGERGAPGPQGIQGIQGIPGTQGIQGVPGPAETHKKP